MRRLRTRSSFWLSAVKQTRWIIYPARHRAAVSKARPSADAEITGTMQCSLRRTSPTPDGGDVMAETVIQHVLMRLNEVGVGDVFGVAGDYAFPVNDAIVE